MLAALHFADNRGVSENTIITRNIGPQLPHGSGQASAV
jgi:hypothetical protein